MYHLFNWGAQLLKALLYVLTAWFLNIYVHHHVIIKLECTAANIAAEST